MSDNYRHVFIIGAQRSGTTYLYAGLDAHPNVYMAKPIRPEPKYFLSEEVSLSDYRKRYFQDALESTVYLGEKSTSYYEIPGIAERIAQWVPDARILFVMRNPVQRALSNYFFSVKNGIETRSLKEVFLEPRPAPSYSFKTSVDPFNYLGRSDYLELIRPFKLHFGAYVHVMQFEDIVSGQALPALWNFLGLPLVESKPISELERNAAEKVEVSEEVIQRLSEYFRPKIEPLEEFLDMDLGIWK